MADSDDLTPEQRLLKLIEEQSAGSEEAGRQSQTAQAEKPGAAPEGRAGLDLATLLSPEVMAERIEQAKTDLIRFFKEQKSQFTLRRINQLLRGVTICFGFFLVVNGLFGLRVLGKDYRKELAVVPGQLSDLMMTEEAELASSLFDEIGVRNVFTPIGARPQEEEKVVSGLTLRILEMTENLRLTGISVHPEDPRKTFCMIEDLEKNITTFLKLGDTVSGLTVEEIKPDSVILTFQDEKIEIR